MKHIKILIETLKKSTQHAKKDIYGVEGWLLFLVISLCFLGPLGTYLRTTGELSLLEEQYPTLVSSSFWLYYKSSLMWGISISIILRISAGFMLWKNFTPASVRYAIFILWSFRVITVIAIIIIRTSQNIGLSFDYHDEFAFILGGWLLALFWTIYLLKSHRVRNTYYNKN